MTGELIVGTAEEEQPARGGDEGSADAVLVWNGLVASIHRVPCSDAPAATPTSSAEATKPVRARAPAASHKRGPAG